jgi:hypothetical protein
MRPAAVLLLLAAAALAAPAAVSAQALDLPPRKPGLWEVATTVEKPKGVPAFTAKMCINEATDRELMDYGLKLSAGSCRSLTTRRDGPGFVIDAECTMAGKPAKSRTVITGDLQSAYAVRMEGSMDGGSKGPQSTVTTQTATWKSADCPGMKPGDMTVFGGIKVNIKQLKALSGLIR